MGREKEGTGRSRWEERGRGGKEGRRGKQVDKCLESSDCILVRRLLVVQGRGEKDTRRGKCEGRRGEGEVPSTPGFTGSQLGGKTKGREIPGKKIIKTITRERYKTMLIHYSRKSSAIQGIRDHIRPAS